MAFSDMKLCYWRAEGILKMIEDITYVQRDILCIIANKEKGCNLKNHKIAEQLLITKTTVKTGVRELRSKNYIRIAKPHSPHRELFLTDKTKEIIATAIKEWKAAYKATGQANRPVTGQTNNPLLAKHPDQYTISKEVIQVNESVTDKNANGADNKNIPAKSSKNHETPQISCDEFVEWWNGHDTLPKIHTFTDQRKRALATRSKEPVFCDNWQSIIDKLSRSPFHTGQNERKWRADVDWILKNDTNYVKILELTIELVTPQEESNQPQALEATHELTDAEADKLFEEINK